MSSVLRAHPRYAFLSGGLIALVLLLLASSTSPDSLKKVGLSALGSKGGEGGGDWTAPTLKERLGRAESLWEDSVKRRHELHAALPSAPPFTTSTTAHLFYTLWNFFTPSFPCPYETSRVGTLMDGGKFVCGLSVLGRLPEEECVLYSFGVNGESSFEAEVLEKTNCRAYGYDFSVQSWGPEINNVARLRARSHFGAYMLAGDDDHTASPPRWTLKSLMKLNGHKHISILKIDIEGGEFEVLTDLIKSYAASGEPLPFGQLQIEIHALNRSIDWMIEWWEMLEEAGLRAFWTEPNLVYANIFRSINPPALSEYSFINVRGNHPLISS